MHYLAVYCNESELFFLSKASYYCISKCCSLSCSFYELYVRFTGPMQENGVSVLTDANFDDFVFQKSEQSPVLVEFYAPW